MHLKTKSQSEKVHRERWQDFFVVSTALVGGLTELGRSVNGGTEQFDRQHKVTYAGISNVQYAPSQY